MVGLAVAGAGAAIGAAFGLIFYKSWKSAQIEAGSRQGFIQTPVSKLLSSLAGSAVGLAIAYATGWKSLSDVPVYWAPVVLEMCLIASKNKLFGLVYHATSANNTAHASSSSSLSSTLVDRNAQRIGVAKLYDRLKYTLYVIEICLTAYVAGAVPEKMYLLYAIKMAILFPMRIIEFRQQNLQLYNSELCLAVNYALLFFCFAPESVWATLKNVSFFPSRETLFSGIFGLANGPVAWYLIAFDGAVSFMDRGRMTSTLIHHAPPLVTFCLVHHSDGNFVLPKDGSQIFVRALQGYACWAAYQLVFVLGFHREAIEKGELLCVFSEPAFEPIRKLTRMSDVNRVFYFLVHGGVSSLVTAMTPYFFANEKVHFAYLFILTVVVIWNGSEEVYQKLGESYQQELKHRLNIEDDDEEEDAAPPEIVDKIASFVLDALGDGTKKTREELLKGGDLTQHGLDSMRIGAIVAKVQEAFKVFDLEVPEVMHASVKEIAKIARDRAGKGAAKIVPAPISFLTQIKRPPIQLADGETLAEKFLNTCDRLGPFAAVADDSKPGGNCLTYARLKIAAILVATYIQQDEHGCAAKDRVGIMMPASVGATVLTTGAMVAGKVTVMLNFTAGADKISHMIRDSGITRILTSSKFVDVLKSKGIDLPSDIKRSYVYAEDVLQSFTTLDKAYVALWVAKGNAATILNRFDNKQQNKDVAAILYTSGSTANPKGVPLTNRNVIENLKAVVDRGQITSDDIMMGALPPFHSFGFSATTVMPVIFGARVVYFPSPTSFFDIARQFARWRPTMYLSTPSWMTKVYSAAAKHPEWTASLKKIIVGAEACPQALKDTAKNFDTQVIEGYGITECAPAISTTILGRQCAGVGFPIDNCDVRVVELGPAANLAKCLAAARDDETKALLQGQIAHRAKLTEELEQLNKTSKDKDNNDNNNNNNSKTAADEDEQQTRRLLLQARLARPAILAEIVPDTLEDTGKPQLGSIICCGPNVFGDPSGEAYLGHKVWERNAAGEYKFDPFLELDGKFFYNTEDLGSFTKKYGTTDKGVPCLTIGGRLKRFVKRGGEMISLGAIEAPLASEFPPLQDKTSYAVESCTVKVSDGGEEPRIGALVTREAVDGDQDEAEARIRRALGKAFNGSALNIHMPDAVILVADVPLLGTGKLDLRACKQAVADYFTGAKNLK